MEDTIVTTEVEAPVVQDAPPQDIITPAEVEVEVPTTQVEDAKLPIEADVEYQVKVINDLIAYTEELETSNQSFAKAVEEKEAALATLNEQLSSKDTSLEQLNVKLQEMVALETMVENMEAAWSKVAQHEILGAINQAIANGEEVDIPKYLESFIADNISALPQFVEDAKTVPDKAPASTESLLQQTLRNLGNNY